ncbi:ACT domain-containing protein [Paraburkholderia terrae]|uniref:ACT domain-containing protein n=1 Tax=Paraburkholderia TaxID=1822464 RepID=UPI001EE25DAF|nr:ACT domain-containing protein [Paraburkholderia terrae]BEU21217.1 ACT domain-containing protein [Paraburkholderia sp. 22B1P]GJH06781.1 ACT domain-containing protein [Paraburkholderia terrae]GJH38716.1 ACT domain-containing protein [Paraburkholderia hospita]
MSEKDLAMLCATLSPVMAEATYVYCSFPEFTVPTGLLAFCIIREREGLTAIIERDEALRRGLAYTYDARLITLSVHSSLEAVGFIAVISRKLAGAGISCNVIAGYYHDHILVPVEKAEEAMTLLLEIAASPG